MAYASVRTRKITQETRERRESSEPGDNVLQQRPQLQLGRDPAKAVPTGGAQHWEDEKVIHVRSNSQLLSCSQTDHGAMVGSKHAIRLVLGLAFLVLVDEACQQAASIEDPQCQQELVVMAGTDKATELVQPLTTSEILLICVVPQSLRENDVSVGNEQKMIIM
jgi:hypothetical protein